MMKVSWDVPDLHGYKVMIKNKKDYVTLYIYHMASYQGDIPEY